MVYLRKRLINVVFICSMHGFPITMAATIYLSSRHVGSNLRVMESSPSRGAIITPRKQERQQQQQYNNRTSTIQMNTSTFLTSLLHDFTYLQISLNYIALEVTTPPPYPNNIPLAATRTRSDGIFVQVFGSHTCCAILSERSHIHPVPFPRIELHLW